MTHHNESPTRGRPRWSLRLPARAAFALALLVPSGAALAGPLKERPMVPPAAEVSRASVVSSSWIELYLPEDEYTAGSVKDTNRYVISSADDSDFANGIKPTLVQRRHFPESAPFDGAVGDACKISVAYRVYLKLPAASKLKEGKNYKVTVDAGVGIGGPYTFKFDAAAPNDAIHANQVAYLPVSPKVAYISSWTGEGTVDFGGIPKFKLINVASGQSVFEGNITLNVAGDQEPWSKSNVYGMDFSAFTTPGKYRVYVPGVGSSRPFEITAQAFNQIGYTLLRGLSMQRDGDHGLDDAAVTHWTRPPAHLDDAIMESNGKRVDLVGGHMDAGDRGKYPHNTADVALVMLTALKLFPDEVEAFGESMQIPESGNGVPDFIDEAVYELEFLYKAAMFTPKDGTQPFYLRPQNGNGSGGYEMGQPPEGKKDRKFYDKTMGPNRSETLYVAGALAMAANDPLLKQYLPAKAADYLAGAKRAFNGFVSHHGTASYWKDAGWYDPWKGGPTPWADEMLVAATNLYEATGDQQYIKWIKDALPANLTTVKHWSWQLTGPWLPAFVSLYSVTKPGLDAAVPGIKAKAHAAIVNWGDSTMKHNNTVYKTPFGMPLMHHVQNSVGWHFSGEQIAFPAMVAYGVTQDAKYKDVIIKTWNYLLGTNPLSRTYVSGLGDPQRSPRWMVHEIGHYLFLKYKANPQTGWSEIPPGIPSADVQNGQWDGTVDAPWNAARKGKIFPALNTYPPLYRYHDSWTVKNEFTIDRMARGAVSVVPLLTMAMPGSATSDDTMPEPGDDDAEAGEGADSIDDVAGDSSDVTETASDSNVGDVNAATPDTAEVMSCTAGSTGRTPSIPMGVGALALSALLLRARRRSR